MATFFQMLDIQLTILLYILIGYMAYKQAIINDKNRSGLMQLLIQVLLPIMVFNSFKSVTLDLIRLSFQAALLATVIYTINSLFAGFLYHHYPTKKARIMHYGTLVNNAGFAGLPLAEAIYGPAGAMITSVYLAPHRLFTWTAGLRILGGGPRDQDQNPWLALVKNPSILAVILGLIRGLFQIPLPAFVDRGLAGLAGSVTPLAMILIGSIIATVDLKDLWEPGILYYSVIRLLVIPGLVLTALTLIGVDDTLRGVMTLLAAMPIGTPTAVLAEQFDLDVAFAAKLTFTSIIASVFTVPLIMSFV